MSRIQFLASSKPFIMPEEIENYHNNGIDELDMCFSVYEADKWWCDIVKPVLSMPYIYEVGVLGNHFFVYLEKYMDIGDVIELYEILFNSGMKNIYSVSLKFQSQLWSTLVVTPTKINMDCLGLTLKNG